MQSLPKHSPDASELSEKQADSLAKKRARDRRAQQNQRDKRNQQVRSLQEQLTRMESRMLHLTRECELLRQENQQLRERRGSSSPLATSRSSTPATSRVGTRSSDFWSHWPGVTGLSVPACLPIKLPSPRSETCPWTNTPAHSASDVIVTESFRNWLERPDLVHASPEHPQPVELLYGSKTNFLADVINHSLRSWPCRDPERLAAGWLIYNLIKWMLRPTPENYGRLHDFQIPIAEQLENNHAHFIDFVHWPQLRANIIRYGSMESPQDVLGMFLCCVKLRWPWGQNFLEPEPDGTLKMRQDFFETFTSLDGWGLTDDFVHKFPALGQGLDMDAMRYRIC